MPDAWRATVVHCKQLKTRTMKRLFIAILIALMCLPIVQAKDKEVILIMQITPYQRNKIPAKTDELKLKTLTLNEASGRGDFVQALQALLQRVAAEDLDHITFKLQIEPVADGDGENDLTVRITGFDLMLEPAASRSELMGALQVGHKYFIVRPTPLNRNLLKSLFVTRKEKIKFVREFELVTNPVDVLNTQVDAEWLQGELWLRRCVIADENKLNADGND